MTQQWDRYTTEELRRMASGQATRYQVDEDRRYAGLHGLGGEVGSFLSSAADSATLGFGDELWGLTSGVGAALSGGDFGSTYNEATERARQRLRDAWRFHSGSALGGAIVGALPMGGAIGLAARGARGAAALRNLTAGQRIMGAMGTGAGFGGVYGAGSSEGDLGDRAVSGAIGAGVGAVTGGALHGLGEAGGHLWRNAITAGFLPEERAARELGKAMQRAGITSEGELARRARELQRMERFSPGSNPMVMDALGEAGTGVTQAAATRQSAGRTAMQQALEGRNEGARQRVDALLVRDLGDGRRTVAQAWEELDDVQRNVASPLYDEAFRQTVNNVPQRLRQFVEFNSRKGARFRSAIEQARESMRRMTGNPDLPDEAMFRSPRFWHQLQENVSAEVGAVFRSAKMNPLQGPRGTAVGEMVQDDQMVSRLVRQALGGESAPYARAQNAYAGAERLRRAWEIGFDAVKLDGGEMNLAGFARQISRMSESERQAVRDAAISGLRRAMAQADTGIGRSDVLRRVIGTEAKRNTLRAIFGGEAKLGRVLRTLDYERRLFLNYADTNIGRGSPTADKLMANQQMFMPNEIGGVMGWSRRMLGREAQEQFDEQTANAVLDLMRTPVAGPGAPANIVEHARRGGLLARSLREAERREAFRGRAGVGALQGGAVNALGFSPNEWLGY